MLLGYIINILSATENSGASISLKDMTPFITALSGIATGFLAARRSDKADKIQQEQTEVTSLIQGYTSQIGAYSSIVTSLQDEVLRLRTQFDLDRKMWEQQKADAAAELALLHAKFDEQAKELALLRKPGES